MRPTRALPAALAVLALAGCGAGSSSPGPGAASSPSGETVSGALTITSSTRWAGQVTSGSPCIGMGGMDDIAQGTTVRVAADDGTTLALGALGAGQVVDGACRFPFTIPGVPLGDGVFYIVEVGNRGQVRVERGDLLAGTVALTL